MSTAAGTFTNIILATLRLTRSLCATLSLGVPLFLAMCVCSSFYLPVCVDVKSEMSIHTHEHMDRTCTHIDITHLDIAHHVARETACGHTHIYTSSIYLSATSSQRTSDCGNAYGAQEQQQHNCQIAVATEQSPHLRVCKNTHVCVSVQNI